MKKPMQHKDKAYKSEAICTPFVFDPNVAVGGEHKLCFKFSEKCRE